MTPTFLPLSGPPAPLIARESPLLAKARELEAAFLAEMLGHAGLGAESGTGFGDGIGEQQFSSFLREEQARLMVARGGIGLAERLFQAMQGADHAG